MDDFGLLRLLYSCIVRAFVLIPSEVSGTLVVTLHLTRGSVTIAALADQDSPLCKENLNR